MTLVIDDEGNVCDFISIKAIFTEICKNFIPQKLLAIQYDIYCAIWRWLQGETLHFERELDSVDTRKIAML